MTSPRPETTDRVQQPEDEEKPRGVQLSATQLAAGALAAVSSAVVASFFGLAGTLIGAALASVISTTSAALYSNSLQKTNERLRRARSQLTGKQARIQETRVQETPAAAPATQVLPAHLDPRRAPARTPRPRWIRVAGYAAAVFVMAMGIVTGIELLGQRPVSSLVGDTETTKTTTLTALTNASSSTEREEGEPSAPSSPTTTAPATGTQAPAPRDRSTSEDEAAGNSGSGSATPTRTSEAGPTTGTRPTAGTRPTQVPDQSSGASPGNQSVPAAEPTG